MSKFHVPKLSRRRVLKAAGVLAAGVAMPSSCAFAPRTPPIRNVRSRSSWPIRPAAPPTSSAACITAALQQSTGKTFVIENIGGAGGNIGMGNAARSEPDGYTILLATNAYSVNAGLYNKLPYDPAKDFVGFCELATSPQHVRRSNPHCRRRPSRSSSRSPRPIRKSSPSRRRRWAPRRRSRPRC